MLEAEASSAKNLLAEVESSEEETKAVTLLVELLMLQEEAVVSSETLEIKVETQVAVCSADNSQLLPMAEVEASSEEALLPSLLSVPTLEVEACSVETPLLSLLLQEEACLEANRTQELASVKLPPPVEEVSLAETLDRLLLEEECSVEPQLEATLVVDSDRRPAVCSVVVATQDKLVASVETPVEVSEEQLEPQEPMKIRLEVNNRETLRHPEDHLKSSSSRFRIRTLVTKATLPSTSRHLLLSQLVPEPRWKRLDSLT